MAILDNSSPAAAVHEKEQEQQQQERKENLQQKMQEAREASPSGTISTGGKGNVGQSGIAGSWQATGGSTTPTILTAPEKGQKTITVGTKQYTARNVPASDITGMKYAPTKQSQQSALLNQLFSPTAQQKLGLQATQTGFVGSNFSYGIYNGAVISEIGKPTATFRGEYVQGMERQREIYARKNKFYFIGQVPRKESSIKKYGDMSLIEKRSILGIIGSPEERTIRYFEMGFGRGSPESYAKFKPQQEHTFIQFNLPTISKQGKNIVFGSKTVADLTYEKAISSGWEAAKLPFYPFTQTIKATNIDKGFEWLTEQTGQKLAMAGDVFLQQMKYGRITNVIPTPRNYTNAGIYFKTGVDIGLGFVFPLEKSIYEIARVEAREGISPAELGTTAALGFAWGGGTKVAKYATEKILISKTLEKSSKFFPKGAKLFGWGVKGTQAAIEYGLPAAYVGTSFFRVGMMPTPEMKRQQSSQIAKEMSYFTIGAFGGAYAGGISVKYADALSRIYKFDLVKVSKNKNYNPNLIMMGSVPLTSKYTINLFNVEKIAKFRSVSKMVREDVIKGEENFPTASSKMNVQYDIFKTEKRYNLPEDSKIKTKVYKEGYVWHATPGQIPQEASLSFGSSEVPGFYGSSEASIYFLKLRGEGYPSYSFKGETTLSPTLIRHKVLGFDKIPKGFKRTMSLEKLQKLAPGFEFRENYLRESEFALTSATKGFGYVIGRKSEIEALIPAGTISERTSTPYYTKIPSISQAQGYEFFNRKGYPEAVRRVNQFRIFNPSTYFDKYMGRKAGQIKEFGIRRGMPVPIELRDVKFDIGKKGIPSFSKKGMGSSSEEYFGEGKVSGYNLAYLKSYAYPSSIKGYSYLTSSKSSVSSSKSSMSSVSSRVSESSLSSSKLSSSSISSASSSKSSSSSLSYSKISSAISSTSSSSRKSYGFSKITTITKIEQPSFNEERRYRKKKKTSSRRFMRGFKYTSTIRAGQFNIRGIMPIRLTGVEERPLRMR